MSNDNWGPWVRHDGGETNPVPCDCDWEQMFIDLDGDISTTTSLMRRWEFVVAYRVKKKPVIEKVTETVKFELYGKGTLTDYVLSEPHRVTVALNATCTYRDGKLISIKWESPDA